MAWWGKVIGGTLGFMMGGPLGALLGSTIGHQFDSGLKRGGFRSISAKLEQTQATFFTATFSADVGLYVIVPKASHARFDSITN